MCEYKGYEVYKLYKDAGISAKDMNRPAFEELLQDIRDKKCNTIVVLKLDRLTRSVYDMEYIMKFLDENNAYLDCANEEINTTNSSGKMVARLLTTVSHLYKGTLNKETKKLDIGPLLKNEVPIRIFPLQDNNNGDKNWLSMGMLATMNNPNDMKVYVNDAFKTIPEKVKEK